MQLNIGKVVVMSCLLRIFAFTSALEGNWGRLGFGGFGSEQVPSDVSSDVSDPDI